MIFFMLIGFSMLYAMSPESFGTETRGTGIAIANIFTRVGGIISPILTGLFLEYHNGFEITITMYACSFLIGGIFVLFLKETRLTLKKINTKSKELDN